jgi:hypothetical protein
MPRYEYPGYGPVGDGWLTKRPGTKGGYHPEYAGKISRSGVIAGYGRAGEAIIRLRLHDHIKKN